MCKENVEEKRIDTKFNKKDAIKESAEFIKNLLLIDPQSQNELFIVSDVQMNEDGSISIICSDDFESDHAIMHTIYSGYVDKIKDKEESDIITPSSSIVGLDGQPLTL